MTFFLRPRRRRDYEDYDDMTPWFVIIGLLLILVFLRLLVFAFSWNFSAQNGINLGASSEVVLFPSPEKLRQMQYEKERLYQQQQHGFLL